MDVQAVFVKLVNVRIVVHRINSLLQKNLSPRRAETLSAWLTIAFPVHCMTECVLFAYIFNE